MKKRYDKPETLVVVLGTRAMLLAGSVEKPTAGIDPSEEVEPGAVESRRGSHNVWDDPEEDTQDTGW